MLCSQMIVNQNPAPVAPLGLRFPLFFDSSRSGNHNSRVFWGLRTLRTHLSPKIAGNSFHVIALRTLAKTTEGVTHDFPFSPFHSLFSRLTPLESVFTPKAPATPLESAFTNYIGGGVGASHLGRGSNLALAPAWGYVGRPVQNGRQRLQG